MSITFTIKNPKPLFKKPKILTIQETLNLTHNLQQYSFNEYDETIDLNQILNTPINKFDCIILGKTKQTGRGVELGYANNEYIIRVNTPSTIYDWETALELAKTLSTQLKSNIECENEQHYTHETIENFDYTYDIDCGINIIQKELERNEITHLTLQSALTPINFNKEIITNITSENNPAQAFSDYVLGIQNLDAHLASQLIFQKPDGKIVGIYVLSEGVDTILPIKPAVELQYLKGLGDRKIDEWLLCPCFENIEISSEYETNYFEFIKNLNNKFGSKYKQIDANQIVVESLTEQELLELTKTD